MSKTQIIAEKPSVANDIARAYAAYQRRMLLPTQRPLDLDRIRAIVRVALRDIVAACA